MKETRQALYARLRADGTLTALLSAPDAIYYQVAPQTARTPYIVFQEMAAVPVWQFAGGHFENDVWSVRAVDRSSSATRAEDIADRVDEVLTDAPLVVTGRELLAVYRESSTAYAEVESGEVFRHVVTQFRLVTEPS